MATVAAHHAKSVYVKTFPYKSTHYHNVLIYKEINVLPACVQYLTMRSIERQNKEATKHNSFTLLYIYKGCRL